MATGLWWLVGEHKVRSYQPLAPFLGEMDSRAGRFSALGFSATSLT